MAKAVTGAASPSSPSPAAQEKQIFPARVKDIILDNSDNNLFKSYVELIVTGKLLLLLL